MNKRIGVYICQCGSNISDYVDVEKVRDAVKDVDGVALAKITMFACADSTQQEMIRDIEDQNLDGLVVASCSPKLHLFTFRNVAERAGMNKYNYVQANIREQGSWAHSDKPAEATEKAIKSVKAAIARTKLSEPLISPVISSENVVLVVGAGIAGMRAALDLAKTGTRVYLVEKDHFVGGRVSQWGEIFPTDEKGREVIGDFYGEIVKNDNITLHTGCDVVSRAGSVGNFDIRLKIKPRGIVPGSGAGLSGDFEERLSKAIDICPVFVEDDFNFGLTRRKAIYRSAGRMPAVPVLDRRNCTGCGECVKICPEIDIHAEETFQDIKAGSVIVATGFDPYQPSKGEFGYGEIENVITFQQMRRLLEIECDGKEEGARCVRKGTLLYNGRKIRNIAWIFCVGSRQTGALEGDNKYCSRYCCASAIHASILTREKFDGINNIHFTRGVRTYGKLEILYEESSIAGDIYLQSFDDAPPVVAQEKGVTTVKVRDVLTEDREMEVEADLVVLVTGMVPRSDTSIAEIMKVPVGRDRFFNEVHPKLKPVETVMDGIFLAGTSQGPKNITETLNASNSAAIKAHALVSSGEIELEPTMAKIDRKLCEWCGNCLDSCPFNAIDREEYEGKTVAVVNTSTCKGCGMCLPVCPVNAIQLTGFSDSEIISMIDALSE
ncbi:MAG: CoB--CoM heterodisulfide reductase iron-sulfur subunit A family protein [Candidatus Krumholzibacteriota bacterium]|nr:CoB--CoM heterodisulfide reductase iron-sulfur subunit A family protein [Candidatus Krumholzibacteriota bacterium]